MATRRLRLKEPFRPSLDRLRVTRDATARRRVAALLVSLGRDELPGREDYETLLYPAGVAWARQVPGRSLWLLYRFDDAEVIAFVLVDRRPLRVGT